MWPCNWSHRRHVALSEPIPTTIAFVVANTAAPCRMPPLQPSSHTVSIVRRTGEALPQSRGVDFAPVGRRPLVAVRGTTKSYCRRHHTR